MVIFFTLLSTLFGWLSFGTHWNVMLREDRSRPLYTYNPVLRNVPTIAGLVLPVIAMTYIFPLHWIWLFFINLIVAVFLSRVLAFLVVGVLWRHFEPGSKVFYFFLAGLLTLVIGLLFYYLF